MMNTFISNAKMYVVLVGFLFHGLLDDRDD